MADQRELRLLDPTDQQEMRRFHEIVWRAETEDGRPWNPCWSLAEMSLRMREPTGEAQESGLCLFEGDELVGAGLFELPLLDNLDKGFVAVYVEPERRHRGIGGALLDEIVTRISDAGRTQVLSMTAVPPEERESSGTVAFAERHGFRHVNTEISRLLPLPLREGLLEEISADVDGSYDGYRIETYVDEIPERYIESYSYLRNQLILDAPTGEVEFEAEQATPEMAALRVARGRRMGRRSFYTLALHDGEAVAHSDLFARDVSPIALQMGTLVHREHRGHRLGTVVKVANLAAMLRDRPDVTGVYTQNAEDNEWMVGINVRLGFEQVGVCPELMRTL